MPDAVRLYPRGHGLPIRTLASVISSPQTGIKDGWEIRQGEEALMGKAQLLVPTPDGRLDTRSDRTSAERLLPRSISWHGTTLGGLEVDRAVGVVSHHLAGMGVSAGSTVALQVDESGRTVLTLLALAARGAAVVLVDDLARLDNPALGPAPELEIVLTSRSSVSPKHPNRQSLAPVLSCIEKEGVQHSPEVGPVDLEPWFSGARVLGVFSSGTTTGVPVLVWKSGPEILENALATAQALNYDAADTMLPVLSLSGQYGSSVILTATALGAGIACCSRARIREILRTIDRHAVTAVDAPPLVYKAIVGELRRRPADASKLASVRLFGVGGEALSQSLARDFMAATGNALVDGYGLTQLGNVAFAPEPGSAGLRMISTYTAAIVDEAGERVPDGATGRVLVGRIDGQPTIKGGTDMWFDTGDLGQVVPEGIRVLGRRGMINRNGTIVPLAWIESRLAGIGVDAYAVPEDTGISQRYWLFVHDPVHRSVDHWRSRLDTVLPGEQRPDLVRVLGALPIGGNGKVDRSRLHALAAGLGRARSSRRGDVSTPVASLRAAARAGRVELIALIEAASDRATAQRDYWSLMNVLNHAEGELGLYNTPPAQHVDVFFPRNAILESFAIYCLVPSLWAESVRLRPARGTESLLKRVVEILGGPAPSPITVETADQQAYVQSVASRPSVVLFTGHRRNAETVLHTLSGEHLFLYFGRGINPVVVTETADLKRAADDIVISRLFNGGQDCLAPDLVLVHTQAVDELIRLVGIAAEEYVQNNDGKLAPLVKDETLLSAVSYLSDQVAGLVRGGTIDYRARSLEPAIVRVDWPAAQRPVEHFSPLFSFAAYERVEQVEELMASPYYQENGFGVALYGCEEALARKLSDHYMVALDQSLADAATPYEPFGGHGIESGFKAHRGRRVLGPINITQAAVAYGASAPRGV